MADLGIVVPFCNEERTAGPVTTALLASLRASGVSYQVALVADGSTDATLARLQEAAGDDPNVNVVCDPSAAGYGAAILHGFSLLDAKIVGWTDGDGQVPPATLLAIHREMEARGAQLGMGLRMGRQDGWLRTLASRGYNWLMRRSFNVRFNDINAKPKLVRQEMLRSIAPTSKDWFIDTEIVVGCVVRGGGIVRVNVPFLAREHGASKVRASILREYWRNLRAHRARLRASGLLGYGPLKLAATVQPEREERGAGAED